MSNDTRIYVVERQDGSDTHLVRASSRHAALRHVVDGSYRTQLAEQDSLVHLLGLGVKVETAGEAPEPAGDTYL